jgi:peptidoglycan/LPS O-acetylase OafA/YrhL
MSTNIFSVIGFIGAALILLAYFQVSRHHWRPRQLSFQACNAAGAALLMLYSLHISAWPNVLLNAVWLAIGAYTLYKIAR